MYFSYSITIFPPIMAFVTFCLKNRFTVNCTFICAFTTFTFISCSCNEEQHKFCFLLLFLLCYLKKICKGMKTFVICTKCQDHQDSAKHILGCLGLSRKDTYSNLLLVLDFLKVNILLVLVGFHQTLKKKQQ